MFDLESEVLEYVRTHRGCTRQAVIDRLVSKSRKQIADQLQVMLENGSIQDMSDTRVSHLYVDRYLARKLSGADDKIDGVVIDAHWEPDPDEEEVIEVIAPVSEREPMLDPLCEHCPILKSQEYPMSATKTVCPITRAQFDQFATPDHAKKLVQGMAFNVRNSDRPFSHDENTLGKLGWNYADKDTVTLDGTNVRCQVTCNIIVQKSDRFTEATRKSFTEHARQHHAADILTGMPIVVRGTANSFKPADIKEGKKVVGHKEKGSLGWYIGHGAGELGTITIEGIEYKYRVQCSITVIGSADAADGTVELEQKEAA